MFYIYKIIILSLPTKYKSSKKNNLSPNNNSPLQINKNIHQSPKNNDYKYIYLLLLLLLSINFFHSFTKLLFTTPIPTPPLTPSPVPPCCYPCRWPPPALPALFSL